ncbi:MAG: phosphonate ABC transporter ATP-binding protein [Halomonas sp.]|nr:phosphonate ABC transporter ATP-binding protein [Halomonas sp.]
MSDLSVIGLHKYYGKLHVLRGLDLHIKSGEGVVLLGANGCGKSTLMRCMNGLETVQAGDISIGDQVVTQTGGRALRHLRRRVGVVFQQFNLVENLSVLQNVLYGAMGRYPGGILRVWASIAPTELRSKAMDCLERVGMADNAGSRCRELSGGQQQRVAIARMLMQEPDVILADEPVASLDPKAGREVMDLLWEVVRERRLTVFCTLHQLELATAYADRIVGMKAGEIVLDSKTEAADSEHLADLYRGNTRVDAQPATAMDDTPKNGITAHDLEAS